MMNQCTGGISYLPNGRLGSPAPFPAKLRLLGDGNKLEVRIQVSERGRAERLSRRKKPMNPEEIIARAFRMQSSFEVELLRIELAVQYPLEIRLLEND